MTAHPAAPSVGPADRTTFFEEQARHRRRTLRFAVVSALAVLAAGIPMSLVVSPAIFLVTLLAAHLAQLVVPLPPAFWASIDAAGGLIPALLDQLRYVAQTGTWTEVDLALVARFGLLAVAPGMALALLVWLWVRALLRDTGVGGVLATIGARDARPDDLEERQLANLVEEMAIAGGLRPPRLLLLDLAEPNAAAIGATGDDAAIVVTRGLLDRLDRDETQGVIGHLVGSVGNGDLRIAWLLLSVFQTYTLLSIIMHAPSSRTARRNAWLALRGLFGDRARRQQIAELLTSTSDSETVGETPSSGTPFVLLRAPFVIAAGAVQVLTMMGSLFVFGPALGALWRARRYLADATAVQLTRNPHGMANALLRLADSRTFAAGTGSHLLFVVWGDPSVAPGAGFTIPGGLHPTISRRIKRLQATGARIRRVSRQTDRLPVAPPSWVLRLASPFLFVFMVFAYAVMVVAVAFLIAATIFLTALSIGITAAAIAVIHWFFGILPELPAAARTAAAIARDLFQLLRDLVASR